MLLLTDGDSVRAGACAGRLARSGAHFLDAAGLQMTGPAVRAHLGSTERTWLVTLPSGMAPAEAAMRWRRPEERVLLVGSLSAGDLGTLIGDATEVLDAVLPMPELTTRRLRLGFPTPSQIDAYHDDIIGTDLFDTIQWDGPSSPRELHDYWHRCRQLAHDGLSHPLNFALIEKNTERYIGGASLRPIAGNPEQIDIGYALAPHAHGRGLGTEAIGALVDEAFENRGCERILATVFEGNIASRRVAEKLGFVCEGTMRKALRKRGVLIDKWMMGLTRSDWLARR